MKANECVEKYDSRIREYVNYSYRQARTVCKTIGEREAGSENEKKLQLHVKEELETCADKVITEDFKFAGDYKLLQSKVGAVLLIIASAVLLFTLLVGYGEILSIVACAFGVLGIIASVSGKVYSSKKLTSTNVYGVKKATGTAKQRLIFVGNADCVRTVKLYSTGIKVMIYISAVVAVVLSALILLQEKQIVSFLPDNSTKYLAIPVCIFLIADILVLLGKYDGVLGGANKNLTGTFTSAAVLKFLKDMNISFENVEIGVLVTGAHEADMSGAKEFIKAHSSEFKDIPTKFICLDCLKEEKDLRIQSSSSVFAAEMLNYSKESGTEIQVKPSSYSTDADVFAKAGFESCAITASNSNTYSEEDTYEDMKIRTIEIVLKCIMWTVFEYNEK